jgi:hypothetical protein
LDSSVVEGKAVGSGKKEERRAKNAKLKFVLSPVFIPAMGVGTQH